MQTRKIKRRYYVFALLLFLCVGTLMTIRFIWPSGWRRLWFTVNPPTVSVVMPVYNRVEMLPRAVNSILGQTWDDFEFIIVDDGSTDDTWELLKDFEALDSRIILLRHPENQGISKSRNDGNDIAHGTYIAIMDSDDISLPERLQKSVAYLENNPAATAVNSVYIKTDKGSVNNWVPPPREEVLMNFGNYYTHLGLIRRDFIERHGIRYDEEMISSEDYDMWAQVLMAGGRLEMMSEPLLIIRRHRTNTADYYRAIQQGRERVSARLLGRFGITPEEAASLSRCELMARMIPANQQRHIISEEALEFTYRKECTEENLPPGSLYIKHKLWLDNFIPHGPGRYRRESNGDTATVLFQDDRYLVVQWEDGREEVYEWQEDSFGYRENPPKLFE